MKESPDLIITVGLPAAGKTTATKPLIDMGMHYIRYADAQMRFERNSAMSKVIMDRYMHLFNTHNSEKPAAEYLEKAPHIAIMRSMLNRVMNWSEKNVRSVIDHVNNLKSFRKDIFKILLENPKGENIDVAALWVDTPLDLALRNLATRKEAGEREREHEEWYIRECQKEFEPPTKREGFSRIIHIRPEDDTMKKLEEAGIREQRPEELLFVESGIQEELDEYLEANDLP